MPPTSLRVAADRGGARDGGRAGRQARVPRGVADAARDAAVGLPRGEERGCRARVSRAVHVQPNPEGGGVEGAACDVRRATYSVQPATCNIQHETCNIRRAPCNRFTIRRVNGADHYLHPRTHTRTLPRTHTHTHARAHTRALQALVRDRQKFQAVAAQQLGAVGRAWAACSAAIECALPPTSTLLVSTPRHPMHRTYLVPRAPPPPSFRAASGARCDSARTVRHWADRWPHLRRDVGHICAGTAWGEARRPT